MYLPFPSGAFHRPLISLSFFLSGYIFKSFLVLWFFRGQTTNKIVTWFLFFF